MKKTGRNEACPCNSGKKYKKCCLLRDQQEDETLIFQAHQVILKKYFSVTKIDLQLERRRYERQIIESIPKIQNSVELLTDYITQCEKQIENIVSKYQIYDLIFWSRRLAPKNIFNVAETSVMLYKEIQALSIYKYGNPKEELFSDEVIGVIPQNLKDYYLCAPAQLYEKLESEELPTSIINIISDTIRIEILCYLYLDATQCYRIANKGAEVFIDGNRLKFNISEELNFLINLYDERILHANAFSSVGAHFNPEFENSKDSLFCPSIQVNVDHKQKVPFLNLNNDAYKEFLPNNKKLDVISNYILGSININEVYRFLNLFSEEFQNEYSYSVEEFICFLGFTGLGIISNMYHNPLFQVNILNRAYSLRNHSIDTVVSEFKEDFPWIYKTIFGKEISNNDLEKFNLKKVVESFKLDVSQTYKLDLWTRGPKKLFHSISENKLIVDYTALTDIVAYVTKNIARIDGQVGDLRGGYFEDSIVMELEKSFNKESIWVFKRIIEANSKTKEIDATLIIDDILFLIEAKAINVSFGFDKGDKRALDFRKKKMEKALKESNEKADFLLKNKEDLNIKLPNSVKYICPIVLSSFPEYIWAKDDELFISIRDSMPRIITIDDIKELNKIDLDILRTKKWVLKIEE